LSLCLIQRRALKLKNRSTACLMKNRSTACLMKNRSTACLMKNRSTACLMKNRSTACPHAGSVAYLDARRPGGEPFVLINCRLTGPQSCSGRFENLCPCRGSSCRPSHNMVAALSDFVSKIKPQKFAIGYWTNYQ